MTQNIEYGTPGYLLSVVSYLKLLFQLLAKEKLHYMFINAMTNIFVNYGVVKWKDFRNQAN